MRSLGQLCLPCPGSQAESVGCKSVKCSESMGKATQNYKPAVKMKMLYERQGKHCITPAARANFQPSVKGSASDIDTTSLRTQWYFLSPKIILNHSHNFPF